MKSTVAIDRRRFLRLSSQFVALTGCLALGGVEQALAQAAESGKPLLTQAHLNRFIVQSVQAPATYRKYVAAAKANLLGFLKAHFTLTEHQEAHVKGFDAETTQKLHKALDQSLEVLARDLKALKEHGGKPGDTVPPPVTFSLPAQTPPPQQSTGTEVTIEIEHETKRYPDGTSSSRTSGKITIKC